MRILPACSVTQSCPTLRDPVDSSPPGSSAHGILQVRILEWGAISFSRGSSQPRDETRLCHTVDRLFTNWATRETQCININCINLVHSHKTLSEEPVWSLFHEVQRDQPTCQLKHLPHDRAGGSTQTSSCRNHTLNQDTKSLSGRHEVPFFGRGSRSRILWSGKGRAWHCWRSNIWQVGGALDGAGLWLPKLH